MKQKKKVKKKARMVHTGLKIHEKIEGELIDLASRRGESYSEFTRRCIEEGLKRYRDF